MKSTVGVFISTTIRAACAGELIAQLLRNNNSIFVLDSEL